MATGGDDGHGADKQNGSGPGAHQQHDVHRRVEKPPQRGRRSRHTEIAQVNHHLSHVVLKERGDAERPRRLMTPVGLMSLRTSTEANMLIPAMCMILRTRITKQELAKVYLERVVSRFERLRSLSRPPYFVQDDQFDVMRHICEHDLRNFRPTVEVPEVESAERPARLLALVDELCSHPLSPTKPLWELHIIANADSAGRCALLSRVHHSVADGISMGYATYCLFDEGWAELHASVEEAAARRKGLLLSLGDLRSAAGRLVDFVRDERVWHAVWMTLMAVLFVARMVLLFPVQAPRVMLKHARLYLSRDPPTPLTPAPAAATTLDERLGVNGSVARPVPRAAGCLGSLKRTAFVNLDFAEVKRTSEALGVTVNDVVLCGISGVVAGLTEEANLPVAERRVRVGMPVNVRLSPKVKGLHNKIGAVVATLPLSPAHDAPARLAAIHRDTMASKNSPEALMCFGMAFAMALMPVWLASWIVDSLTGCTTCMLTNVRFFNDRVFHVGGHRVTQLIPWVAPSPNIGTAFCCTNFANHLIVAVTVDAKLQLDPWAVLERFQADYRLLVSAAGDGRSGGGAGGASGQAEAAAPKVNGACNGNGPSVTVCPAASAACAAAGKPVAVATSGPAHTRAPVDNAHKAAVPPTIDTPLPVPAPAASSSNDVAAAAFSSAPRSAPAQQAGSSKFSGAAGHVNFTAPLPAAGAGASAGTCGPDPGIGATGSSSAAPKPKKRRGKKKKAH